MASVRRNPASDACASNLGHCLWVGLVDEDKAPLVAERLLSPEMFSGWGVRTLASDMGAYNPASHHTGSVWPHDNAVIVAGLLRYGFVAEAQQSPPFCWKRRTSPTGGCPSFSAASAGTSSSSQCPIRRPARRRPGQRPHQSSS